MCEVAETEKYGDRCDVYHVTMTSLDDVTESLDYVINIDSSPFTRSLSTGDVTPLVRYTDSDETHFPIDDKLILIVNYKRWQLRCSAT